MTACYSHEEQNAKWKSLLGFPAAGELGQILDTDEGAEPLSPVCCGDRIGHELRLHSHGCSRVNLLTQPARESNAQS